MSFMCWSQNDTVSIVQTIALQWDMARWKNSHKDVPRESMQTCTTLQNLPIVSHVYICTQLSPHETCNLTLDSSIFTTPPTKFIPIWPPPKRHNIKVKLALREGRQHHHCTYILKWHLFPADACSTCNSLIHFLGLLHIQIPFLSISWRHVTLN
jgi:hypothetical protein